MNLSIKRILTTVKVILVFCVLGLCAFPVQALAEDTLRILTGEWPPFVSESLPQYGYTAEIVSYAFLAAGLEPEFAFMPWKRCALMVEEGKELAAFPYVKNEERSQYAVFSERIAESRSVFFYMKSELGAFEYSNLENLKQYRVGGAKGFYYEAIFRGAAVEVDYSNTQESMFKKLYLGRIQLAPSDERVGWLLLRKLYPGQEHLFASTANALTENKLHVMFSKMHPKTDEAMARFNEGLRIIKENGVYNRIMARYSMR